MEYRWILDAKLVIEMQLTTGQFALHARSCLCKHAFLVWTGALILLLPSPTTTDAERIELLDSETGLTQRHRLRVLRAWRDLFLEP